MSDEKNRETRRKEAQEAMAGPERHKRIIEREAQLAERRKQAAAAMEGPEQRQKRIAREKSEHEKETTEKEKEYTQKRADEMEQLRKKEAERLKQTEEETKKKADEIKLSEIKKSEETIAAITKKSVTTSSLRTFKGDMARAIERGASQTSIVLAEEERRRAMGASIPEKQSLLSLRMLMWVGSVVLFLGGFGVLGYVFIIPYFSKPASVIRVAQVSSILPAEETRAVDISGMRSAQIVAALSQVVLTSPSSTDMLHIYFTNSSSGTSTATRINTPTWQQVVEPRMPLTLARTLSSEFMYGILRGSEPSGFLILSVDSPSNALSGMLAWEKTLANDMIPLITGGTGEAASGFSFQDRILRNLDTRILTDETGKQVLLYSVLSGKKYVVITRDQTTFDDLITRLASPRIETQSAP